MVFIITSTAPCLWAMRSIIFFLLSNLFFSTPDLLFSSHDVQTGEVNRKYGREFKEKTLLFWIVGWVFRCYGMNDGERGGGGLIYIGKRGGREESLGWVSIR